MLYLLLVLAVEAAVLLIALLATAAKVIGVEVLALKSSLAPSPCWPRALDDISVPTHFHTSR